MLLSSNNNPQGRPASAPDLVGIGLAMGIDDCKLMQLPKITEPRGNLTVVESGAHLPFEFKRIFYVYDIPTGTDRGAHAHKTLHQFVLCVSGSFDVTLDDGFSTKTVHLNRPWLGLHIPPLIWAAEVNFDPGSVLLVLASNHYDQDDYVRDYGEFLRCVGRAR
jgi:dTDP-4-dehydrorhamnose 3,5-epimerase-like enzyme